MSQLRVSGTGQQDFFLNVLNFDSPVMGEMNSGQTKTQVQYFPIKAFQPELVCNVIFNSETTWEAWQAWARTNMVNTQNSNNTGNPGVTLNWPERNINNWTGIIPAAKAGGMRRNYTPRTRVEFQLIVSLVSNLGIFSSFGSAWQGIFGGSVVGSNLDSIFQLPENLLGGAITGGNAGLIGTEPFTVLNQTSPGFGSSLSQLGSSVGLSSLGSSLIPGVGSLLSII
ncbi:MAG TPA: hypothetical protein VH164_13220 [Ktedonobacteraceae bacterium]|nr:hypothetical protein [Ktedonobacteraceae bacterium]